MSFIVFTNDNPNPIPLVYSDCMRGWRYNYEYSLNKIDKSVDI